MNNPPAFQFYPQDFIADGAVQDMTMEERGVYITMLCRCWIDDGIAKDGRAMALLSQYPQVAQCFHKGADGKMRNKRLDAERQKQIVHRKAKSDAGLRGAQSRWQCHDSANGNAIANDGSSSSSSSSYKNTSIPSSEAAEDVGVDLLGEPVQTKPTRKPKRTYEDTLFGFNEFWNVYPRKVSKIDAEKEYSKIFKSRDLENNAEDLDFWKRMIGALERQVEFDLQYRPKNKILHPHRWLKGAHWNDEVDTTSRIPEFA